MLTSLWGAEPAASLGLYASTCLIAPLLALIFREWGVWALLACTSVLVPVRVALAQIQSLGATGELVRIRDAEIASAKDSARAGRRDERLILAGDLHDEVLPALFKVHLMGEVLKQDLASGRLLDLDDDLPELLDATTAAQEAVRRVVGDLRSADCPSGMSLGRSEVMRTSWKGTGSHGLNSAFATSLAPTDQR